MKYISYYCMVLILLYCGCKKNNNSQPTPVIVFTAKSVFVNGINNPDFVFKNLNLSPVISIHFAASLVTSNVAQAVSFVNISGVSTALNITFQNGDSTLIIQVSSLQPLAKYTLTVATSLQSKGGGNLQSPVTINLTTAIDSTDKFLRITSDSLLTLVQKQTFKYFWDFGHPVSGMARERNASGDVVTTGGTGFGIMAMIAAASRGFISRSNALSRITLIADFYKNNCTAYHGAYSHWINGATGATVPFSAQDDGADLVETSYLMQGLLCARQYFNTADANETALRNTINGLWDAVEWTWFQQNSRNVLYWQWSPNFGWAINQPIQGWNEALIVYALAASSRTHPIAKAVYDSGWAQNGAIKTVSRFITSPFLLAKIMAVRFSLRITLFLASTRKVYPMRMRPITGNKMWRTPISITAIV